jgi:excisionase family DNA binding protein
MSNARPVVEPAYYSTDELATYLNESAETIRDWRKKGLYTGPLGIRLGRNVRYPRKKVHELLEQLARDQGAA